MDIEDEIRSVGIIVAHPDDETLWAGGTILMHPEWRCSIFTICRADDPDRAPRFKRAVCRYGAQGRMAGLDDGLAQNPLTDAELEQALLELVGEAQFDLLLTHGARGEYSRHRRHEEVSRAVVGLWQQGRLGARELWLFAYEDGEGEYLPQADQAADLIVDLPAAVWETKYRIIGDIYGFANDSWEARTTPATEAFRKVRRSADEGF